MSKIYNCKRCGYNTKYKQTLQNHLIKKNECCISLKNITREKLLEELDNKEIKKHVCNKCNKELGTRQSKYRHQINCTKNDDKDKIKDLENKIEEMTNLMKTFIKTTEDNKIVVNNTTNNNTVNILIENLRPFGNENYEYISKEIIKDLVQKRDMLYILTKKIHFNNDHPENWNYFIGNLRGNKSYVYRGKRFNQEDKHDTLNEMLSNHKDFLAKEIDLLEDIMDKTKETALNRLEELHNDEAYLEMILRTACELAYNSREKIQVLKREIDKKNKLEIKL